MYVGIHSADQQNAYNHNYSEDIENNENSESSGSSSKSVNSVRLDQAALEMGLAHVPDASETQVRTVEEKVWKYEMKIEGLVCLYVYYSILLYRRSVFFHVEWYINIRLPALIFFYHTLQYH